MEVTGGALCTDKIWWYLIHYIWKQSRWIAEDPILDMNLVATEKMVQEYLYQD